MVFYSRFRGKEAFDKAVTVLFLLYCNVNALEISSSYICLHFILLLYMVSRLRKENLRFCIFRCVCFCLSTY